MVEIDTLFQPKTAKKPYPLVPQVRLTRSFLKCEESLYKPEVQSTVTVMHKRQIAKQYHDQSAKQHTRV